MGLIKRLLENKVKSASSCCSDVKLVPIDETPSASAQSAKK